jgi:hypothetical protein
MAKPESLSTFNIFLLVFAAATLALWPAWAYGPPLGHSLANNLVWLSSFDAGVWRGEAYPRWLPELWFGAGAPDFFFYGPLPFWVTSLFGRAVCWTCSTDKLLSAGTLMLYALSGFGYSHLARRFFDGRAAVVAGLLYVILPYHLMVDWGVRQALGEISAFAMLPFVASALVGLMRNEKWSGLALALSVAGLVLSHLPSVVLVAATLGPLALVAAFIRSPTRRQALRLLGAASCYAALGLGLSAFYWWPAFKLLPEVSSETLWQTAFNWSHWLFFDGVDEPNPPLMLVLKFWLLVITAVTGFALWRRRPEPALLIWCVMPLIAAWFFMTPLSWPVWSALKPLQAIQFPWRFMMVAEFGLPLVLVWALPTVRFKPALAVVAVLAICSGWGGMRLSQILGLQRSFVEAAVADHLSAWEYLPRTAFDPVMKLTGGKRDAVRSDWAATPEDVVLPKLRQATSRHITLHIAENTPRPIVIKQFYWPLWRAKDVATHEAITLSPEPKFGLIALEAPAGARDIALDLGYDRSEIIGFAASLASLFFGVAWALRLRRKVR